MTFGRFSGCGWIRFVASAGITLAGNGGPALRNVQNRPVFSLAGMYNLKKKAIWLPVQNEQFHWI